jgi:hypothetical protein
MIELKNITYKEFLESPEIAYYDFASRYGNQFNEPIDHFKLGDAMSWEFGTVKDIQYDLQTGLTWDQLIDYLCKISNKDIEVFKDSDFIDICQQKTYILSEINKINEVESIKLNYNAKADEINAGIDKLGIYGIYLQIRKLAKEDITKIKEVRKMKYQDCFIELCVIKDIDEYTERYNAIIQNKNK